MMGGCLPVHSSLPSQHCRPWSCFLEWEGLEGHLIAQPGVKTIVGVWASPRWLCVWCTRGPSKSTSPPMGKERGKSSGVCDGGGGVSAQWWWGSGPWGFCFWQGLGMSCASLLRGCDNLRRSSSAGKSNMNI